MYSVHEEIFCKLITSDFLTRNFVFYSNKSKGVLNKVYNMRIKISVSNLSKENYLINRVVLAYCKVLYCYTCKSIINPYISRDLLIM